MNAHTRAADQTTLPIVGWREVVSLPEWGVDAVEAKIDTGARTSAIHVEDVVKLSGDRVRFHLVTARRRKAGSSSRPAADRRNIQHVPVTADLVRRTRVRSSTGHAQERFVVATTVRIGHIRRKIEMSLVGRDKMLCRMLIGRTALHGMLIHPDRKYLHGAPKKKAVRRKERE